MQVARQELLARATIQLSAPSGPHPGTGFFVAPGRALTSAHLVGLLQRRAGVSTLVPVEGPVQVSWEGRRSTARIDTFVPEADLALLAVDIAAHPCVFIQPDYRAALRLHCFGHPPSDSTGRVCFPTITGWRDQGRGRQLVLDIPDPIDLSGFSGAALLNQESGGVCAMVVGAQAVDWDWLRERVALHGYLCAYFAHDDLTVLCDELGFALDDLPGADRGRDRRVFELIRFLESRNRVGELIAAATRARPHTPFQPDRLDIQEEALQDTRHLFETTYRDRFARGLAMSSVLEQIAPDLVQSQRTFHAADTRWIDTFDAAQMLGAGACFPQDVTAPSACPYPGLRPFDRSEHFYGREEDLAWLLQQIDIPQPLLILSGASGSGKSSLLQAGLLPRLRQRPDLHIATGDVLRLTEHPDHRLLEALEIEGASPSNLDATVRTLLDRHAKTHLVLLIDQFEDILSPISGSDALAQAAQAERQAALDLLRRLWRDTQVAVTVLLVVRPEARATLRQAGLATSEALTRELRPLVGENLRTAIRQPASDVGVHIEPELVERLATEAHDIPSPLPLIQATLESLWRNMRRRQLTLQAYSDNIGALPNAIQRRADAGLTRLTDEQIVLVRNIMLRLVDFHDTRNTRRPQTWEQLATVGRTDAARIILDQLVDMGLLVTQRYHGTIWVELCHEALITHWGRLRDEWLGQASLRACESQRREWERWVESWERSGGTQLITSAPLIAAATQWDTTCGQSLGAVPKLPELIRASQRERSQRRWGARIILLLLIASFLISILATYLFTLPILPD